MMRRVSAGRFRWFISTPVRFPSIFLATGLISLVALVAATATAQGQLPTDEDDEEPWRPGLRQQIATGVDSATTRIAVVPRWSELERTTFAASTALPSKVTWRGTLWVPLPGSHRLAVHGAGRFDVKLQDRTVVAGNSALPVWTVSEPLALDFGELPLEIEFTPTDKQSRFALFWAGPQFSLEPIPPRNFRHAKNESPPQSLERGRGLVTALRCAACHEIPGVSEPVPAPALDRLGGQLHARWLHHWLTDRTAAPVDDALARDGGVARRMPQFGMSASEAEALAEYLLTQPGPPAPPPEPPVKPTTPAPSSSKPARDKSAKDTQPTGPDAQRGRELFVSLGCLACHRSGTLGRAALFSGTDLTLIADKRPADFFARWLADPALINRHHRMPVFELTAAERADLARWLATPHAPADSRNLTPTESRDTPPRPDSPPAPAKSVAPTAATEPAPRRPDPALVAEGRELFHGFHCDACHAGPHRATPQGFSAAELSPTSRWDHSCLTQADATRRRPGFALSAADQKAVREYVESQLARQRQLNGKPSLPATRSAHDLVAENNCLACHARDDSLGIAPRLPQVVEVVPTLSSVLPALAPPALTSVGDKLHDAALLAAITRRDPPRRSWLRIRMPRFRLSDDEQKSLVGYFVEQDRVPPQAPLTRDARADDAAALANGVFALRTAGGRLVTSDGFGCVSCHQIGDVVPPNAPLNARAPSLSLVGQRVRREWFDRWVRNPARIVPRMEMPSVQLPVRGLLDDQLDRQLAAVWNVLNLPDFQPPEPNPVQTLRLTGTGAAGERAELITDILQADGRTWIKPLLIGLPNRHNLLFDLESNRLARWSLGDVARQRTKGKTWFWEAAGLDLLQPGFEQSELELVANDKAISPLVVGQFPTEADQWRTIPGGLEFRQRLRFATASDSAAAPTVVHVAQRWLAIAGSSQAPNNGVRRELDATGVPDGWTARLRGLAPSRASDSQLDTERRQFTLPGGAAHLALATPTAHWRPDGTVDIPLAGAATPPRRTIVLEYRTNLANDQFPTPNPVIPPPGSAETRAVPGFVGTRLPLPIDQMPTALAWQPNGDLVLASLKGRVWLARDTDRDGLEDHLAAYSDELAAPYGLATGEKYIDVSVKFGVLRLWDEDGDGRCERTETLASGWGHTADYHDWTVGLPRDEDGCYYVGLACQQDKRSPAAAYLRGTVVKLVPRTPTSDDPRRFEVQLVSGGHRFPMGFVRLPGGELFVTDNQGNYNPFNELNHVLPGRRYGFINALEQKPDFKPPTESPAIEIPHPWTRSVNGICWLDLPRRTDVPTPANQRDPATPSGTADSTGVAAKASPFGPLTGQIVGCEYDTRRLIRMSVQRVGDVYQGAAYPLSLDAAPDGDPGLLGPLCAAVSPRGDLYVGGIRDSGWGGGNNVGEIVRLKFDPSSLPAGIAEVQATSTGFALRLTRPVDAQRLARAELYSVSSYRRVSTPAYGGADQDRRTESIVAVKPSTDAARVELRLAELRPGFVYEIRVQNLTSDNSTFYPAEAHYTLRKVP